MNRCWNRRRRLVVLFFSPSEPVSFCLYSLNWRGRKEELSFDVLLSIVRTQSAVAPLRSATVARERRSHRRLILYMGTKSVDVIWSVANRVQISRMRMRPSVCLGEKGVARDLASEHRS